MDQGLQDLIALAEHVATDGNGLSIRSGQASDRAGKAAKDWLSAFSATQVLRDQLIPGSDRSKTTLIGKFLAARGDRSVNIETSEGPRSATLRCHDIRSRQKAYYFEIAEAFDEGGAPEQPQAGGLVGAAGVVPIAARGPASDSTLRDADIGEEARGHSPTWL
jgi:hypothetical protein